MCISKTATENLKIYAEGEELEQVQQYQYLGSTVTEDGKIKDEIRRRIGKAKTKFWESKELLRRNINIELKKKMLKCYVFPVLGYGCETWHFTNETCRRLKAFEMWCYRRMQRISWRERVTNKEVLKRAHTKRTLLQDLTKRKMRYAGHLMRGSVGQIANTILEGTIEGVRSRGKQRIKWIDDIKNWTGEDSYHRLKREAEDRKRWRTKVANLRIKDGT